jgi:ABC-type polysaccharide/polyol phosphate export permease
MARHSALDNLWKESQRLLKRRELIWLLVASELKRKYRRAVLGFFWWMLEPFLYLLIYYIVFQVLLHQGEPAFLLFLFCAILPWRWFASATSQAVTSVSGAVGVVRQLAFPRAVYPISAVSANAAYFLCGLIVLFGFMVYYGIRPSPALLFLPLVVAVQSILTLGFALWLAGLGVFFTDLQVAWTLIIRLWFYLSPGFYAMDRVPEPYRFWFMLNPFAILFEAYRSMLLHASAPDWGRLGFIGLFSGVLTVLAFLFFTRLEPRFAKVL